MALATHGRKCAGNATDHDMNSTIVASFSRDVGVLEAMVDLSDDIEKFMRCTATEHAFMRKKVHAMHCYRACVNAGIRAASCESVHVAIHVARD